MMTLLGLQLIMDSVSPLKSTFLCALVCGEDRSEMPALVLSIRLQRCKKRATARVQGGVCGVGWVGWDTTKLVLSFAA